MGNTILFGTFWVVLIIGSASGDFTKVNVTKSNLNDTKTFLTNATITAPPPPDVTNRTSSLIQSRNQSELELPEISNPPPKAISVGADHNSGYAIFSMPPVFHFPDNQGVEETFTYQVKKQRRSSNVAPPADFRNQFDLLGEKVSNGHIDEMQSYIGKLEQRINEKARNITTTIDAINYSVNTNITRLNASLHELNAQVNNLTALSKETSRSLKIMQYIQDKEKSALLEQVLNLTESVEKLRVETTEDARKLRTSVSTLQGKLENTTHDVRMHEAYLRYGQQTMASMKTQIDKNLDKLTGFETDSGPQWTEQTIGCGGVVEANSGIISYKFRQAYFNNERCIWIIRANRRSKINLQLLEDGFQNQSNSDFLTVTEFAEDQHPVTLITSSRLEHGNNALHTFQGPVIFVTFYSDASLPGTGFTLRFDGIGNRTDGSTINAIRHLNLHFPAQFGNFVYPEDRTITYQPNELVTLAINPYNATSLKIHMKMSDLEKDEYCEFDSISFYGSVTGSYALTKRYCPQGEHFNGETVQSSDGLFLVIFRSDASTQFSGFEFKWEME